MRCFFSVIVFFVSAHAYAQTLILNGEPLNQPTEQELESRRTRPGSGNKTYSPEEIKIGDQTAGLPGQRTEVLKELLKSTPKGFIARKDCRFLAAPMRFESHNSTGAGDWVQDLAIVCPKEKK